jgi:hypothetical protein
MKETFIEKVQAVVSREYILFVKEGRNDGPDKVKFPCLEVISSGRGRGA